MTSVTIGLDVSDRYSRMCVLDSKGRVMEEGRVRTSPEGLARRFGCEEPARVVLEVGTHSPWMSEQLKQLGHEVLVANPRRLKLIYGEHDKTDRLDAEHLARVGRMDPKLLKTVQHRGRQARADLAVIRSRDALVKSRTQLVSHVRGAVKSAGCRIPRCSTPAFARTAPEHIPERLKGALEPVLETIAMLTGNIQQYERQIGAAVPGAIPGDTAAPASGRGRSSDRTGVCADARGAGTVQQLQSRGPVPGTETEETAVGGQGPCATNNQGGRQNAPTPVGGLGALHPGPLRARY